MIATVRGSLLQTGLDWVIVDVSGVGYKLFVPPSTISELKSGDTEVTLSTHLAVRDDAMVLYGFVHSGQRDTFETLLSVSGIGPRTALAALSVLSPAELRDAVEASDLATLQRVPGIGKKSAQRMVLELGGKLAAPEDSDVAAGSTQLGYQKEVAAALEQLGWSRAAAEKTIAKLGKEHEDASSLLRAALLELGRSGG